MDLKTKFALNVKRKNSIEKKIVKRSLRVQINLAKSNLRFEASQKMNKKGKLVALSKKPKKLGKWKRIVCPSDSSQSDNQNTDRESEIMPFLEEAEEDNRGIMSEDGDEEPADTNSAVTSPETKTSSKPVVIDKMLVFTPITLCYDCNQL